MKRVLVAPLDWGLGHASRCVPVINELVRQKNEVIIGASGRPLSFLKSNFPDLESFSFPGTPITYSSGPWLIPHLILQLPKFLSGVKQENLALLKIVKEKKIDLIISDNRYGLYHPEIKSAFITHQLKPKFPFPFGYMENFGAGKMQKLVRPFHEIWIPDEPGEKGLSGDLSKHKSNPKYKYVGFLSRFQQKFNSHEKEYDLLMLLSGPEPQRSIFEKKLLETLEGTNLKTALVRGIPGEKMELPFPYAGKVFDSPEIKQLEQLINDSEKIIARPGYSTLMDLQVLGGNAIFIPTPGQTEQEYLGARLAGLKIAPSNSQKNLTSAVLNQNLEGYTGFTSKSASTLLKNAIEIFCKD